MRQLVLVLGVSLLVLPKAAHAHFNLVAPPPPAAETGGGKGPAPCGPDTAPGVVTPAKGGQKLLVKINETVPHPGFYRIALSINSRTELPLDNVVKDKDGKILSPNGPGDSATADYQTTPVFPVLADHAFAHTTAQPMAEMEITLPNVTCTKCTLQVIEFMAQHGPSYFYHHCADLNITADPNLPPFNAGAGGAGAGGAGAGGASGSGGQPAGGAAGASNGGMAGNGVAGASGGAAASSGASGASVMGVAGAPAAGGAPGSNTAGSSALAGASSTAGSPGTPASDDAGDSGGCSLSPRSAGSAPLLSLLLGLFLLGRRRSRRWAA